MSYIGDVSYDFIRLISIFAVFFGLVYALGKLSKEKYVLKKYSRFETDLKNYAVGFIVILTVTVSYLISFAYLIDPQTTPEITFLDATLFSIWILISIFPWLFIFGFNLKSESSFFSALRMIRAYEITLICIFISLFIYIKYQEYVPISVAISTLFLICCILGYVYYRLGRNAPSKRHIVSIYLEDCKTPLNGLSLYQTTDVDYRFVKQDEKGEIQEEVVIPISNVKKIEYPAKEDKNSENQGEK